MEHDYLNTTSLAAVYRQSTDFKELCVEVDFLKSLIVYDGANLVAATVCAQGVGRQ